MNNKETVLVTGATGFIGGNLVKRLLQEGYQVRGGIRTLNDPKKVKHFYDLPNSQNFKPVLTDLYQKDCWAEAIEGCKYVIHTAIPFSGDMPKKNQYKKVLKVIAESEELIFRTCIEKKVKRYITTSSLASVNSGHPKSKTDFTESDFCVESKLEFMLKFKWIGEKVAWKIYNENKDKIEFTVILPPLVIGKTICGMEPGSAIFMKVALTGEMPSMPKMKFAVTHVDNMVDAYVNSMTEPKANGQRYMILEDAYWVEDLFKMVRDEFKPRGYKVTERKMWYFTFWLISLIDPMMSELKPSWDWDVNFDNSKSKRDLNIVYKSVKDAVSETCNFLIDQGYVKRSKKDRGE